MEIDDALEKQIKQIEAITDVLISSDCRNFQKDTVAIMAENINKSLEIIKKQIHNLMGRVAN